MKRILALSSIVFMTALAGSLPTAQTAPIQNGAVSGNGQINILDIDYLARHIFCREPPPAPVARRAKKPTVVFLVRHAEDDKDSPLRPLTEKGKTRAQLLAEHFTVSTLAHVFSSHKTRTLQTVQPTAGDHGLEVQQLPPLGSEYQGEIVTEETSTSASIKPTIEAILSAPRGSVILVAGHSSTLFAIMAGLGVRVRAEDKPCEDGDTSCLPGTDKSCFPKEFDNLWVVAIEQNPVAEAALVRMKYGEPCKVEPVAAK